jgi:hypothetical protein
MLNERKLRRGDVVHERHHGGYIMYGRVWRRIDKNHVVVIDCGKHIQLFHEDELVLTDYDGRWAWRREPGNDEGKRPKWMPMTSLRRLKSMAREYHPDFGGRRYCGYRWTKQERREALANPRRHEPRKSA